MKKNNETESAACIEAIFSELEGKTWLKSILRQFLRRPPDEAADGCLLILHALEMRADEGSGSAKFDDDEIFDERGQ